MDDSWIEIKKKTFMGRQGEFVNNDIFKKYLEQHGEEKTIAYLQAMNDFTRQLEVILDGGFVRTGRTTTGKALQNKIENLVVHNNMFLKNFSNPEKEIVIKPPTIS